MKTVLRRISAGTAGGHCPRCRVALLPDSRYCDHCALPLTPETSYHWLAAVPDRAIVREITPYRQQIQERWGIDFGVRVGINTEERIHLLTRLGRALELSARMPEAVEQIAATLSEATLQQGFLARPDVRAVMTTPAG